MDELTKKTIKPVKKVQTHFPYKNIKTYRKDYLISQNALAKLLGCTSRTVRRWEAGERQPPLAVIKLLREFERNGKLDEHKRSVLWARQQARRRPSV